MAEGTSGTREPEQSRFDYWLELAGSILLAAAVIATAFCAYEATRWSGVQATAFASAGSQRNQSVAALSTGNTQLSYDATTFGQFVFEFRGALEDPELLAEARELAGQLMRAEFLVYLDEWLASDPLNNPDAAQTPFELDSFANQSQLESERLVAEAEASFQKAKDANQTGDDYILATVFFASVLFFTGISSKFVNHNLKSAILILATVGLIVGIIRMSTLPFH